MHVAGDARVAEAHDERVRTPADEVGLESLLERVVVSRRRNASQHHLANAAVEVVRVSRRSHSRQRSCACTLRSPSLSSDRSPRLDRLAKGALRLGAESLEVVVPVLTAPPLTLHRKLWRKTVGMGRAQRDAAARAIGPVNGLSDSSTPPVVMSAGPRHRRSALVGTHPRRIGAGTDAVQRKYFLHDHK